MHMMHSHPGVPSIRETCELHGIPWTKPTCAQDWWPLFNVWLGTSVSDQSSADLRVPHLLATPAAIRFISAEPLLGAVDVKWALSHQIEIAAGFLQRAMFSPNLKALRHLDWVIVGGESGPHARPMHPDWARSLRDQCVAAGVPFLFKQWGEWIPIDHTPNREDSDATLYHPAPDDYPEASRRCKFDSLCLAGDGITHRMGKAGGYHVIQNGAFSHPQSMTMFRIGKKRAGRKLDGVEWSQFPEVRSA